MKIRVMGTEEECLKTAATFLRQRNNDAVANVEVSRLYQNRSPSRLFRLYVEINMKDASGYSFPAMQLKEGAK